MTTFNVMMPVAGVLALPFLPLLKIGRAHV